MKLSKEIKVLAAVLALCLLVGIGCGAAVMNNSGYEVHYHGVSPICDGAQYTYVTSVENMASVTFPIVPLMGEQAPYSGAVSDVSKDISTIEAHPEPPVIA